MQKNSIRTEEHEVGH